VGGGGGGVQVKKKEKHSRWRGGGKRKDLFLLMGTNQIKKSRTILEEGGRELFSGRGKRELVVEEAEKEEGKSF